MGNTSEHPLAGSDRHRLLPVAIVLASCVLAAACSPAAVAKSEHSSSASGVSGNATGNGSPDGSSEQSQAGARAGKRADGHEEGAGSHEQKRVATDESQGSEGHEQQVSSREKSDPGNPEQQTPGTAEAQIPTTGEHRGGHERVDHSHRKGQAGESSAPGSREQHDSGEHKQRDGGNREQHTRGHRERGDPASRGQQVAARSPAVRSTVATGTPRGASAPASAAVAPLAHAPTSLPAATPTATTPTAGTPGPVPGISLPIVTRDFPQSARHSRPGRAHKARGPIPLHKSSPGALASAGGERVTPAGARETVRPRRTARAAPISSRPSPIVTTITRIVGVVPSAVWILIGALLTLALAMALRSRLLALRARRLERQRGELLEDVGLLQAALLPLTPARLGPVGTSAAYRPADGPAAGGDFYDLFALEDGQLAVIVGDVSGHGRQALPHTALIRFTLRAYLEAGLSPREALKTAGTVLDRQLGGSFATLIAATYHPRDRLLVYACAGHPPPIVQGSKSMVPITICSAPPIGVGMRTGTRQTIVSLPGSSRVCLHTDGVTEARAGSELYGAKQLAHALAELGPKATATALLERVSEETTSRPDDMAACLLCVEGDSHAPRIVIEELELDHEQAVSDRTEQFLLACGVERRRLSELMLSAQAVAGRAGTVLMELRLADGPPEVSLRGDNVAFLYGPNAGRGASRGASG